MRHEARPAGSAGGAQFDPFRAIELGYSVNNQTIINAVTIYFIS
jgi:hypothetical protein